MRGTVGFVAISTRRYIDWMQAIYRLVSYIPLEFLFAQQHPNRYIAFFGWTLAIWITYQPLINTHRDPTIGAESAQALTIIGRFLFGIFLCSAILLFEKFSIQYIAGKFHERSYAGASDFLWMSFMNY